ncbi:carboxymuconolactone decarboxylase family protein [Sneathiella litorea]|nr:carboxymuconolactone decarboxylase family protein [Sneathiella litorea]
MGHVSKKTKQLISFVPKLEKSENAMPKGETLDLNNAIGDPVIVEKLREKAPSNHGAAEAFWQSAMDAPLLSPRLKELVLLGVHASASSVNETAMKRHIRRACSAGASEEDVIDVLISIVGQANHALYFSGSILVDELQSHSASDDVLPDMREDMAVIKKEFLEKRGFWHSDRETLARLMPDYFIAQSTLSVAPWQSRSLTPRERELIFIAIDSSASHNYEAGLRLHIRNALKAGAHRDEIIEVMHLVALMGLEGYLIGVTELLGKGDD